MTDAVPPAGSALQPTSPTERIVVLDVLRGFALLGVLVVNLPDWAWETGPSATRRGAIDAVINAVVAVGFEGRFLGLFSILFGVGFVLQAERAARRGTRFVPVFFRRLAVLLVFGLLHALIYPGDILVRYALLGLLLPIAIRASVRTLTLVVAVLVVLTSVGRVIGNLTGYVASEPIVRVLDRAGQSAFCEETRERIIAEGIGSRRELYERGRLSQVAPINLCRLAAEARWWIRTWRLSEILACFLIGMILGKIGFFTGVETRTRLLKSVMLGGILVGYALLAIEKAIPNSESIASELANRPLQVLGHFLTTLAYGSAIVLAFQTAIGRRILSPLQNVGRMALTAYLGQSLIATTLFYGYGFGLGKSLSSVGVIGVAVGIYAILIPSSWLWFRYFRLGPLEWIWRSITYGRIQPMRAVTSDT